MVIRKGLSLIGSAFLCLVFSLPSTSHAESKDPTALLDHGLDLFDDHRFQNAEEALLKLERMTTFRRLDRSQQTLVYSHISYSMINRGKERDSLPYIDKALRTTKLEFGERSLRYLDHLQTKAIALYWADQRRKAVRVGEDMLHILERMGEDYRSEQRDVRHLIANMRKVELEEGDLPLDLSDFYSDCESIDQAMPLSTMRALMNDYQLVGSDFKPNYKQAQYFKTAYLKNARESSTDRRNRLIYIPDEDHQDDWCVIYPQDRQVDRVILSASSDR